MKIYPKRFFNKRWIVWLAACLAGALIFEHPYIGLSVFVAIGIITFLVLVWNVAKKSGF